MPTLYKLRDDYEEILRKIEANDGELTPELASELNAVSASLEDKVTNYIGWYRSVDAQLKAVSEELRYMETVKRRLEAQKDFIKNSVSAALEDMGLERFESGTRKAWIQSNSQPSVTIADAANLPDDWMVIEKRPNKTAILDYIQRGGEIPGCTVATGTHLRIK